MPDRARDILDKALAGERLSEDEGAALIARPDLLLPIGQVAGAIRARKHPEGRITFVIDRNINYTNICQSKCRFCAFYRDEQHPDAYVLSNEKILDKIEELVQVGGTQVLIQGGLHPDLDLAYYTGMLRAIKERFNVQVHSFSPPEIIHFSRKFGYPIREMLEILRDAGLDSLPGGGAELLVDRVRSQVSPHKYSWRDWMKVMREAHGIGMRTTATMMFGMIEEPAERVKHMVRLRALQDETGGFTAFIPWSFQPSNTDLGRATSTTVDYLLTLSVARLMLDNFDNIQASWVTQGAKVGQVALAFGANDFGGTMLEENVVRAAGVSYRVPIKEIVRVIKDAGFTPAQRSTGYQILKVF